MISDKKLDQWITAGVNVLIEGQHGVGKSERVIQAMKRNNKKFLYFSASTMDPFIDFIGVPRVIEDPIKNQRWLEFIKPLALQANDIEFLIFDEYNRAPKKVRNATMEILQFKSMNGLQIPNLKAIWAMINPSDEDDTYDVEQMDAAQKDRFQIQVSFPTKPDLLYFENKYGAAGKVACAWWKDLPAKDIKENTVSPRRLAYVLDAWTQGLDISDLLPSTINVTQLKTELGSIGLYSRLDEFKTMSLDSLKKEIKTANTRNFILQEIKKATLPSEHLDAFNPEHILYMLNEDQSKQIEDVFFTRMLKDQDFAEKINDACKTLKTIKQVSMGSKLSRRYEAHLTELARIEAIKSISENFVPSEDCASVDEFVKLIKEIGSSSKKKQDTMLELLKKRNQNLPVLSGLIEQITQVIGATEQELEETTQEKEPKKKGRPKKESVTVLALPSNVWPTDLPF